MTKVVQDSWQKTINTRKRHFTNAIVPKPGRPVNVSHKSALRSEPLRTIFGFRQGLWTEDLRTPPGQECSNGSLILFAVVLWRTFSRSVKLLKVKTARFADLVEKLGKPQPYTLWQKPAADRHFQSALKNHRVMTIQQTGSGTEFGEVGFRQGKTASYLIFPKSLKRFENKRVVGVKWDLVGQQ